MELIQRIEALTALSGLSGTEEEAAAYLEDALEGMGISAWRDAFGNVRGRREAAAENAKTLLLEAHMDRIGLMVSGVDEGGYIRFVNLGGVDARILCGMEVTLLCDPPLVGVIGAYRPKAKGGKEPENAKLSELRIDTGLSQAEAEKRVPPGVGILLDSQFTRLRNGKISCGALDNRAGVAAVLDCLEACAGLPLPYHLEILFSTQEELGLHGAFTGTEPNMADAAIVVDVTHGATPDSEKESGVFPLGCGAVICRGPNLHYDHTLALLDLAQKEGIPCEIETAAGASGTTAWAVQIAGPGIPAMLVSIPLRYMHTNVETLAVSDVEAVSRLLTAAVKGGIRLA